MKQLRKDKVKRFQKEILDWFSKNKRDLPWRRTRDPYKILVSEIMLQQTQVSRVIPKYGEWLKAFPTVQSLAKARTSDILRLWSGLGYNRRALYLKKTAETIVSTYKGKWPRDILTLEKLPGIGKYTAGAVSCFAFNEQIAIVDTNIRKVILTRFTQHVTSNTQQGIQKIADQLLPKGKAYEWNQALMDYAAAMLRKEKIPIAKQSKFIGSNRYYRGKILKTLLTANGLSILELGKQVKHDFDEKDTAWLQRILAQLKADGFITIKNAIVRIG